MFGGAGFGAALVTFLEFRASNHDRQSKAKQTKTASLLANFREDPSSYLWQYAIDPYNYGPTVPVGTRTAKSYNCKRLKILSKDIEKITLLQERDGVKTINCAR